MTHIVVAIELTEDSSDGVLVAEAIQSHFGVDRELRYDGGVVAGIADARVTVFDNADELVVFPGDDGNWHWHREAPNNVIVSAGQGHRDQTDAKRAGLRACPDILPAAVKVHNEPLEDVES